MKEFSSELAEDAEPEFNPLEGIKFGLDGEVFECFGSISLLEDSELADMAAAAVAAESHRGRARLARSLRLALGDEEYVRFFDHCAAPPRTPDGVVLAIMQEINSRAQDNIEQAAARPTEPSPPSSGGPEVTEDRTARVMKLGGDVVSAVPEPQVQTAAPAQTPAARRRKGAATQGTARQPEQVTAAG